MPSVAMYFGVISACSKSGQWREALATLNRMTSNPDIVPDLRCYNSAMAAMSAAGKFDEILVLLEQMRLNGVDPTVATYNIAINAAARAKDFVGATALLDELKAYGLEPDGGHVSLLKAAGLVPLRHTGRSSGFEPVAISIWGEDRG